VSPKPPKYDNAEIPTAVALAAPAVRMVVVVAWHNDEDGESTTTVEINPVLAIQSKIVTSVARAHRPGDYHTPSTLEEADRNGYHLMSTDLITGVIVHSDDHDLCEADDAYNCMNMAWQTAVCPWDPSEDDARLSELIEYVKGEAVAKVREHKEKESAPVTSP
jgi:hypothetical protein